VAGALMMGVVFLAPSTVSAWSVGAWVLLCVFAFFELPAVRARTAVRPLHLVAGVAVAAVVVVSASLVGSSRESTEFAESEESAIEVDAVRAISGAIGLVDGFPATPEATLTVDGAVVVTTIETDAVVSVLAMDADGEPIPLGLNDRMQVTRDGALRIRVSGAGANLSATVWLFSEPILVGNGVSNDDGVIDVTLEVPDNAPDGYHTIQVRLTDAEGQSVSIALPVQVGGEMLDASA